jgi:GNAT superfamily N-acetyltransferase
MPEISVSVRSLGILLPVLFSHYPIGYLCARSIIKQTELMHNKYASEAHYYLDNLAVLPEEQGKDFSSQLMRSIIDKADSDGVMAYTDTVTGENIPLYEHFGFQVMEEHAVEKTGITVWALRRAPR